MKTANPAIVDSTRTAIAICFSKSVLVALTLATIPILPVSSMKAAPDVSQDILSSPATDQEYFIQVSPASRVSDTFLNDLSTLRTTLAAEGITVDAILTGTTNLYLRCKLPPATVEQRQNMVSQIKSSPMVQQVIAGIAASMIVTDLPKLTVYSPIASVPESNLRGFRPKQPSDLSGISRPHTNRILIRYLQDAAFTPARLANAAASLAVIHQQFNALVVRRIETRDTPYEVVAIPADINYAAALKAYQDSPVVESAIPAYITHIHLDSTLPNDPYFSNTLYSPTIPNEWQLFQISAPSAWDTVTGTSSIKVGLIDTGFNYNHNDLSANIWSGPGGIHGVNEIGGSGVSDGWTPASDPYHGTYNAGLIAAVGNNSYDGSGVAWSSTLLSFKIFDYPGGTSPDQAEVLAAMSDAASDGCQIVNMSFGWSADDSSGSDPYYFDWTSGYDSLRTDNILVTKSAGNSSSNHDGWSNIGNDDSYTLPNMLYVGASTTSDGLCSFSDYGQYGVDIFAPGIDMWSTTGANNTDYRYDSNGGTSYAAPLVAGAAELVMQEYPSEAAEDVADRIRFSADYVGGLSSDCWSQGRLNVAAALDTRPAMTDGVGEVQVNAAGSVTVGIVIYGTSSKQIIFRALGPSLAGGLANPRLAVYDSASNLKGSNDDYTSLSMGDQSTLSTYGLTPGNTSESALVLTLSPGIYNLIVSDSNPSDSGLVKAEYHDISGDRETRMINFSPLGYCGTGSQVITTFFTVTGSYPRTVYIHAWGLSLSAYGVGSPVSDTQLTVKDSSSNTIGSNDDWTSLTTPLSFRVQHSYHGFAYPGASSDSVVVLRLSPGTYSAILNGKSGATGTGMIEVDEF